MTVPESLLVSVASMSLVLFGVAAIRGRVGLMLLLTGSLSLSLFALGNKWGGTHV